MLVLRFLFRILAFLYPYKLHCKLQSVRDVFYTLWIRNFIGYLGKHSRICRPCSLGGGGENISIGDYSVIGRNTIISCWMKYGEQIFSDARIKIGNHCQIGFYNHITACNRIIIGDGLLTGCFVIISDNNHGELSKENVNIIPSKRNLISKGEIVIGNNVWLGDKVAVLAGVHIGNNVIVAANAVVTKDIPDNCIAAGVPAKVVKYLNQETE